jgi:hypothetical protein
VAGENLARGHDLVVLEFPVLLQIAAPVAQQAPVTNPSAAPSDDEYGGDKPRRSLHRFPSRSNHFSTPFSIFSVADGTFFQIA